MGIPHYFLQLILTNSKFVNIQKCLLFVLPRLSYQPNLWHRVFRTRFSIHSVPLPLRKHLLLKSFTYSLRFFHSDMPQFVFAPDYPVVLKRHLISKAVGSSQLSWNLKFFTDERQYIYISTLAFCFYCHLLTGFWHRIGKVEFLKENATYQHFQQYWPRELSNIRKQKNAKYALPFCVILFRYLL